MTNFNVKFPYMNKLKHYKQGAYDVQENDDRLMNFIAIVIKFY